MSIKKAKQSKPTVSSGTLLDIGAIFLRTFKLLLDSLMVFVLLVGVFGVGLGLGYVVSLFDNVKVPDSTELLSKVTDVSRISRIVYADGTPISDVRSDLLRTPIESTEISDYLKQAVIATEDETFENHNGVVPKAVLRAALGSIGVGSSSGGSTLTQQLIKQQLVGDAPTFARKANEIVSAIALERVLSKDEILTAYLNVSPFGRNHQGRNIAGVEEAAQGIFGKQTKELTVPQAAFIAGLPQSPIVYSPYSANGGFKSDENMSYGLSRYQDVLYNMYRAGFLTKEEYQTYKEYDIRQDFLAPSPVVTDSKDFLYYAVVDEAKEAMFSYLLQRDKVSDNDLKNGATVQAYKELAAQELSQGGYTVTSTVDRGIYDAMQRAVASYGSTLDAGNGFVETGSVLMDNKTGAILGFVGGRDFATNNNNHALDTVRSPGSTVKPFLTYGIAIDQGLIGSASILSNYPTSFSDGTPIMHGASKGTGMMNLQDALNTSANIPTFWTYKMMRSSGVNVKNYMDKLNYPIELYDIESLPLGGGIETTVAQNTNAYQTLANGGVYQERYIVEKITAHDGTVVYQHEVAPVQVYSKATASIVVQLLRGPLSSGVTTTYVGRLNALNPQIMANTDLIGKTGTSNNTADVWLMVSNPQVTLGTWAGHDDNTGMHDLTGYNNNAQYVAYLTNAIYQVAPNLFTGRFVPDKSMIASEVVVSTGQRPASVQVNGEQIQVSGALTTSYWAKNGAPATSYKFMVGGTESDYQKAWSSLFGEKNEKSSTSTSSPDQDGNETRTETSSSSTEEEGRN